MFHGSNVECLGLRVEDENSDHSTLNTKRSTLLRCRLAGFATNLFAFVPDTFAFVWFGLAHRADFGGELSHELLISAFDDDVRLIWACDREALRNCFVHFVGEADAKLQGAAL